MKHFVTTLTAVVGLVVAPGLAITPGLEAQQGGRVGPIFLSPHAANLPTATTLPKGGWEFEISHRFTPAVSEGADVLWGFDGPVFNRIGLRYATSDRVMIGVQRTNVSDNLEFDLKARLASGGGALPYAVGVMGGIALNTQLAEGPGIDGKEPQWYGQLILNAKLGESFAVGVVPTLLGNADIDSLEKETTVAVGVNGQYYLTRRVSLLGEWIVSEEHPGQEFDSGTFGVEMRAGGHFFKIVLTNQTFMNPTQNLAGAARKFTPDEWRVGFNITRRF